MPRTDEKSRWRTVASTRDKGCSMNVREKRIDIPRVDNKALRMELIARIEIVTLKIIEQISAGQSPRMSYLSGGSSSEAVADFNRNEEAEEGARAECRSDHRREATRLEESPVDSADSQSERGDSCKAAKRTIVDFAARRSRGKFVLMTIMMAEVHRLLLANTTKTRRSFYYDLKSGVIGRLVPHQRYVDRALNDTANLLMCSPWHLRLLATAKGLVAGNMTITLADDRVIDCAVPGGALIPQIVYNATCIRAKAAFVLVVEKDAVFQKLLEENCPRALNCILITGKGYPDVATRMLVKLLSEKADLPVYIVADADPFGVDIMLIYRFGSTALRKSNNSLVCPNARWLGIHPSELTALGAKTIPLTKADLAKLRSIEDRAYVNEVVSRQLSILRKGKAEIETIASLSKNFLTAMYLPYKINGRDYI